MSHWASRRRAWLVLAYVLTTLVVQSGHHHAPDPDEATRCLASCHDNRVHLSGHSAPDLDPPHHDCVACQFRAGHLALILPAVEPLSADSGRGDEAPQVASGRLDLSRASCRAPPSA